MNFLQIEFNMLETIKPKSSCWKYAINVYQTYCWQDKYMYRKLLVLVYNTHNYKYFKHEGGITSVLP